MFLTLFHRFSFESGKCKDLKRFSINKVFIRRIFSSLDKLYTKKGEFVLKAMLIDTKNNSEVKLQNKTD